MARFVGWCDRFGSFGSLTSTTRLEMRRHWRLYESMGWHFILTARYAFTVKAAQNSNTFANSYILQYCHFYGRLGNLKDCL